MHPWLQTDTWCFIKSDPDAIEAYLCLLLMSPNVLNLTKSTICKWIKTYQHSVVCEVFVTSLSLD